MSRRDGATIKRERIEEMHRILCLDNALPASLSFTVATFEYKFGLSKKKIIEYLKILESLDFIVIEGDTIYDAKEIKK